MTKNTTKDMTKGAILPLIIKFTIPLVLGNLLQLCYNAADSIIVGRFISNDALAAVGTSNPIMTLIILFTQGICLGSGILIGTAYGAKQYEKLEKQVSTAFLAGCFFALLITVVTVPLAPWILRLMQVDAAILPLTCGYLRIIMCGLIFSFIYNYFASIMRALGDSKSPLLFLGISAFINIVGDFIFVVWFSMRTYGCAVSTVLCEMLSCVLCWIYIKRKIPVLDLGKKWFLFDKSMLKEILSYGFVSAMQQSTVQIGKLGVQGIVNTMGVTSTAAFAAINRVDDFAYIPEQNIGHAMTSVMAQNRGAGEMERVKKAFHCGMLVEICYGILAGVVLLLFATPIMELFTEDGETIALGVSYLRVIAFMYVIPAITNGVQGYFRGMGDLKITLWSSTINFGARLLACIPLVFCFDMGILALPWAYLIGWLAMMIYELPFLVKGKYRNR
ncbi:MAG: MATE family efflux transporter [Lachnospiraceae bacterium]|nr:MATE family efflux transporter [Lachnospiraceae bacterium]